MKGLRGNYTEYNHNRSSLGPDQDWRTELVQRIETPGSGQKGSDPVRNGYYNWSVTPSPVLLLALF